MIEPFIANHNILTADTAVNQCMALVPHYSVRTTRWPFLINTGVCSFGCRSATSSVRAQINASPVTASHQPTAYIVSSDRSLCKDHPLRPPNNNYREERMARKSGALILFVGALSCCWTGSVVIGKDLRKCGEVTVEIVPSLDIKSSPIAVQCN